MESDPIVASMNPLPNAPARNKKPWLFILMEVGFVALLLFIIFAILVLLNVIKLNSLTGLIHPSSSKYAPTPTPYIYNSSVAEKTLMDYIHETLTASSLPSQITILQRQNTLNQLRGSAYTYSAQWQTFQATISAYFNYNINSATPSDLDTVISFSSPNTISEALAKYFQTGKSLSLKCVDANGIHTCEYFTTLSDKTKFGIGSTTGNANVYIFSCKIPQKSDHYSWKSCIQQYKDNGI